MTTLTLTKTLLAIIIVMQDKAQLAQSESILNLRHNWMLNTEQYFNKLPGKMMHENGLVYNDYCFYALLDYNVTAEMRKSTDLSEFNFTY